MIRKGICIHAALDAVMVEYSSDSIGKMYTWIRFDVSALVTLRLSDPITATISALIGPQRFVIVLIWSMTENRGAYLMLCCQVNSVSPLPLAKSEPEWYLDSAMHLGTSVSACRFHPRFFVLNLYFSHTLPWVYLHSASGWDFSFCCRKI